MRKLLQPILTLILLVSALPMVLLFTVENSYAQGCVINVLKVAPGAEGQEFEFNGEQANGETFSFSVIAGESTSGSASTEPAIIREAPVEGWRFGGIVCEPGGGVAILEVLEDGWVEECQFPDQETFCTVTNIPTVSNIPTLSQWGMIAAVAGLMMVGVFYAVRRKRAASAY